ncbi:MAG: hypothetical protein P9M15_06010 [Candidatus Electryoneaceae bacterium]|nr:hypothetical protein [Candidatus Electryoneaceae bacterium]
MKNEKQTNGESSSRFDKYFYWITGICLIIVFLFAFIVSLEIVYIPFVVLGIGVLPPVKRALKKVSIWVTAPFFIIFFFILGSCAFRIILKIVSGEW